MTTLRIGNGCGFWGDNLDAPLRLAQAGVLDYLTLEYLAELTMSILAGQKARSADAGFATDFLDVLGRLTPCLNEQAQLKIVTNAGGMNPTACAAQAATLLRSAGVRRRIGVVSGDDLLPQLDELLAAGHELRHLDHGRPLTEVRAQIVSANAYLGAAPIAAALAQGAELVITGRVADAALTLGPAAHHFGWSWTDWDRLSAGIVAGHLLECGAQATGGLWMNGSPLDLADVGYPLAELTADGSFVLTKPVGTSGAVNLETTTEQLLYEVGDPAAYLTPDVVADFTTLHLTDLGQDRVRVTGAHGRPAPSAYKVSIAYRAGYTAAGMLVIAGPGAPAKARACAEVMRHRLAVAGVQFERWHVEALGAGDSLPGVLPTADAPEVVLRVAVQSAQQTAVERFSKEFAPLVTAGPPGVTGYTTGRPAVRPVLAYWPALLARAAVTPQVQMWE
jgi:hypothetical protein